LEKEKEASEKKAELALKAKMDAEEAQKKIEVEKE